jgi:hypothetical protein
MNLGEKAIVAVLLYLFRRIEKRLDGSPTLVPLDEAWVYLKHPLFRDRIREWLKTLRKYNGAGAARDAESLRYLQLAHSRRGARKLSYQDSVAERRGSQSCFAPVL